MTTYIRDCSFLMGEEGWWNSTGSSCSTWWLPFFIRNFVGAPPPHLCLKLIEMTAPPPPKKEQEKEKKERVEDKESEKWLSLLFPSETFDLVCFYAFLHFTGTELPFRVRRSRDMLPRENLNFLNVTEECWFFCILVGWLPSPKNCRSFLVTPPLKPYFSHAPTQIPPAPLPPTW